MFETGFEDKSEAKIRRRLTHVFERYSRREDVKLSETDHVKKICARAEEEFKINPHSLMVSQTVWAALILRCQFGLGTLSDKVTCKDNPAFAETFKTVRQKMQNNFGTLSPEGS